VSGTERAQPGDSPYQILGVPDDASTADITRAYRRLLRQHHPDTAPGHTALEARRLQEILAAYQQLRHDWRAGPATPDSGTGVPVTVRHHPGHTTPLRPAAPRQSPNEIWLNASATTDQSTRRRIPIAHRGTDTTAAVTITTAQAGTGAIVTVAAPRDHLSLRNFHIRIPPGTRDGQTLTIPGHGMPGHNGGPPGDLRVTVHHA
jgi:DnaJ-class molecular chaperone